MSKYNNLLENFKYRSPLVNIVLDGYGLGKKDRTDAVFQANTPFMDFLVANFPTTTLATHGKHVGLPGENDLGGSEVGHLTMGAGIIIPQGPSIICEAIKNGSFFRLPILETALKKAKQGTALHLIGLLSDGNIHSHISHFKVIIEEAALQGVKQIYIHALLDGRDVGVQSALDYVDEIEALFGKIKHEKPEIQYAFASGGGREAITMDRDLNWDKVEKGWNCHVRGNSGNNFSSMREAIQFFRKKNPDLIDQDCPPFNILDNKGETVKIKDGDAVLFMNFRGDRAIEITRAFIEKDFNEFFVEPRPDVYFAGMMVYDEDTNMPENCIISGAKVEEPFGKRILQYGLNQFRLTETQKYAHVTFFYNGGYRNPLDPKKELYHLIHSDKIASFASAPEMKAREIADQAEKFLLSGNYHFGLINFANADMVGHTGDMQASINAVEAVDINLKRICTAVKAVGGIALITADHGNADEMIIFNKKSQKEEISTKHSINPVRLILYDPLYTQNYTLKQSREDHWLNLSMIAATNHILLGRKVPGDLNDALFQI